MLPSSTSGSICRRSLLRGVGAACFSAAVDGVAVAAPALLKKIRFAVNASALCIAPVFLGKEKGVFERYGLDVDCVNFGSSSEALIEAIATGKAEGGVGMALRWLKPLEQGFDVKITAGTHGGCSRLIAPVSSGVKTLADLKGKAIGISDQNSPGKHFFAILLLKEGIDPVREVEWKQYPGEFLSLAAQKGEVAAIADGDPKAWRWIKEGKFVQVASNLDHGFEHRVCCIVGLSGKLVREDRATAAALTRALIEAQELTVARPRDAAAVYLKNAPPGWDVEDISTVLNEETHDHHPIGVALEREIALYAEELKAIQVFKPSTDPAKFAKKVYADVLSA
jgi:NitT/TauT family transport system substrate-binding protein